MENHDFEFYERLSDREEELGKIIFEIALKLHKYLGPGLLESIYEKCFVYELQKRGIACESQKLIPIHYEDLVIPNALKVDLFIENLVIVELKAQEIFHPVWDAQTLSYLKLTKKRLGFRINFHVRLLKNGFKRFVL